ncbi:16S rRNA (uracil(1498)-N(3))-methyltransferase [hydrothermal vent metagenome]|uniref:16S rRNA (uracil(1498)-N(3))-methyltransferase n=1 Tax=hydrothermal vent metagenome TaxID=652676 RepID=A0A3B1DH27_9ZZZZ
MPRIILPSISPDDRELAVTGQNLKYLRDVLRVSRGDEVIVLDGHGLALKTCARDIGKKQILLEVLGGCSVDTESPLHLVLIQGLLKGDRMDLVIQKATELGVREIFPVVTERSQVRFSRKLEHWKRVSEEATRQSGRLLVPVIHDVCKMKDIFDSLEDESVRIIFSESENKGCKLPSSISASFVYYMVGPEGGFTDMEVQGAKESGFISAGLGKRILRAETASIAGAVLLQFLFGDL